MLEERTGSAASVAAGIARLKADAELLNKGAKALSALAKDASHADLGALERASEKARRQLSDLSAPCPAAQQIFEQVESERLARIEAVRERLAPDLKAACTEAGLSLRVVSRESPLRLRIAPFGVTIDRDKGSAQIEFAQQVLEKCPADADAIMAAHRHALASMGEFDAARFFGACLKAWKAALATGQGGRTERVEITAFLPYLALEMQPAAFKQRPSSAAFQDYSRERFAFDVMRLREARGLAQEGWRLNLGVATGATASSSNKSRVVWIEDAEGAGEYKLTVFFQRLERESDA